MSDIKMIIFDCDDVFTIGSKEGYFACYEKTLARLNISMNPDEVKRRVHSRWGQPHIKALKVLLKESPGLIEQASGIYEELLFGPTFSDCLTFVQGAEEMLVRLGEKYVLCVATGMHPEILKTRIIPMFHIPDVFATIISAYNIPEPGKQKPHPYMINTLIKKYGVQQDQVIMVGDATSDVRMAYAAQEAPEDGFQEYIDKEHSPPAPQPPHFSQ